MWTEAAISSQFLCRAEGGCEFRELPLVMPPSKVCPQCNAVVPIRLKVCRNRLKFALYNADRVNFKSRNYHVVAYNISILAEGLHFSALVPPVVVEPDPNVVGEEEEREMFQDTLQLYNSLEISENWNKV